MAPRGCNLHCTPHYENAGWHKQYTDNLTIAKLSAMVPGRGVHKLDFPSNLLTFIGLPLTNFSSCSYSNLTLSVADKQLSFSFEEETRNFFF